MPISSPDDKRYLITNLSYNIRFEDPYEAYFRQWGRTAEDGELAVDDDTKQNIADGTVDGSDVIDWIKGYNSTFPEKKISYVVTEDLETEDFSKDPANQHTDCITFSADDIKSLPDVAFRLKDTSRQKELQDADLKVDLQNAGTPDAYLIVSATKYDDAGETDPKHRIKEIQKNALVKKIQNAWRERLKEKKGKEKNLELMRTFLQTQKGDFTLDEKKSALVLDHAEDLLNRDFFVNHAGHTITLNVSDGDYE